MLLDGALATELDRRGVNISGPLWSARALLENQEAIVGLHLDYLRAGAQVIVSASYQATVQGLEAAGHDARHLLERAVSLAVEACRRYRREQEPAAGETAAAPLVAASIGPYGAYLHDGSEYSGHYGLDVDQLVEFHAARFEILAESDAQLLACETVPCAVEAEALARLLAGHREARAWISFSCADGSRLRSGELLADVAARLDAEPGVVALGINCTAPEHVTALIRGLRGATGKPIVVYPNSGEDWDAAAARWSGPDDVGSLPHRALEWRDAGATLIGGCCRVGPEAIAAVGGSLGKRDSVTTV